MNFISIIIRGYLIAAGVIIFILIRDLRRFKNTPAEQNASKNNVLTRLNKKLYPFHGSGKFWAVSIIIILLLGAIVGVESHFIEVWRIKIKKLDINANHISQPIKIAWLTDLQLGNHKKNQWLEKIINKLEKIKPDLILFGGDLINNEGTFEDETKYFEPLQKLAGRYPMYYIMGNHEYGIGSATASNGRDEWKTGDRSKNVIKKMEQLGIPFLRNQLACPEIRQQQICLFGVDDFWAHPVNFDELDNWNKSRPMIFLTHNPDAVKFWPSEIKKPNLALAGHTHGGQVWLPLINKPLSTAEITLGFEYYRGLNHWQDIPIYISSGLGESGGPVRFFTPPEITIVNLVP